MEQQTSHIHAIGALVSDALGQLSKLFQIELALAKAEVKTEMSKVVVGAGLLGAGVLMLVPALVMVLLAIAVALTDSAGFSSASAYLISAAIGGIIAAALIAIAAARMQSMKVVPQRTVDQLRKDRQTLSEVAR